MYSQMNKLLAPLMFDTCDLQFWCFECAGLYFQISTNLSRCHYMWVCTSQYNKRTGLWFQVWLLFCLFEMLIDGHSLLVGGLRWIYVLQLCEIPTVLVLQSHRILDWICSDTTNHILQGCCHGTATVSCNLAIPKFKHYWGRYQQDPSSQLITPNSQIFPVKNSNLQSSGLVGLLSKSSVFKTRQFWNLLSSHIRFWVSFILLSSQGLIFRLPKNLVTPPLFVSKTLNINN